MKTNPAHTSKNVNFMKYPVLFMDNIRKEIGFLSKPITYCLVSSVNTFEGNILIDTSGDKFEIVEIEKTGWAFFWGYHPLFKGRIVKIRMKIVQSDSVTITSLKSILLEHLKNGWNFLKPHKVSVAEWEDQIEKCESHIDIIRLFMFDFMN
jgi:hypothetical protein